MAYEASPTEASDEVAVLFGVDALIERRRAIHYELAEVSEGLAALNQRYGELIRESIGINGTLATQGVDVSALSMELAGRLPDDPTITEDVA